MTTGWALQGGAGFGAAQVGMARALMEAGHHPDVLVGTSAGALNATWLAADPTADGLAGLEAAWSAARRRDVFPIRPWDLARGLSGITDYSVSPQPLRKWLRKMCPVRNLEDSLIPLLVMVTDVEDGQSIVLDHGPAVTALMASCAIPGVFPPVRLEGRWLVDGSTASDMPIGAAVAAGADRVWALPSVPLGRASRPRSALGAVLRSSSITLASQNASTVELWSGRCELYVLPAPTVPGASPFGLDKTDELVRAGYEKARQWLSRTGSGTALRRPSKATPGQAEVGLEQVRPSGDASEEEAPLGRAQGKTGLQALPWEQ